VNVAQRSASSGERSVIGWCHCGIAAARPTSQTSPSDPLNSRWVNRHVAERASSPEHLRETSARGPLGVTTATTETTALGREDSPGSAATAYQPCCSEY
jgi:hypothetical protein